MQNPLLNPCSNASWFLSVFDHFGTLCIKGLNLGKALLFPRNQTICLKNWNLLRAPTTTEFNIFCWSFTRVSCLPVYLKACSGFFLFCLDLELLINLIAVNCLETRVFILFLQITHILNKIKKKTLSTLLRTLLSRKCLQNFSKNH